MYQRTAQDQSIIVGVDRSAGSQAALAWAVQQAGRNAGVVEVVTVLDDEDITEHPRTHLAGEYDPVAAAEQHLARLIGEVRTLLCGPPMRSSPPSAAG